MLQRFINVVLISLSCQFLFVDAVEGVEVKIEDVIERTSAALIVVADPSHICELAVEHLLENSKFQKVRELLNDSDFELVDPREMDELEETFGRLLQAMSELDEVSIVVHASDDEDISTPKFTILLVGDDDVKDRLEENFSSIYPGLQSSGVEENQTAESEASSEILPPEDDRQFHIADLLTDFMGPLYMLRTDRITALSNSRREAEQLLQRIKNSPGRKFRSLSASRAWQLVNKQLGRNSNGGRIRGYVAAQRWPAFADWLIAAQDWQIPTGEWESLSSIGFEIRLGDTEVVASVNDAEFACVADWRAVVNYRVPVGGFAKLLESYTALPELPKLPCEVARLEASAFDFRARLAATKEIEAASMKIIQTSESDRSTTVDDEFDADVTADGNDYEEEDNYVYDWIPKAEEVLFWTEFNVGETPRDFDMNPLLDNYYAKVQVQPVGAKSSLGNGISIGLHRDAEAMYEVVKRQMEEAHFGLIEDDFSISDRNTEMLDYGRRFFLESSSDQKTSELDSTAAAEGGDGMDTSFVARPPEFYLDDQFAVVADSSNMKAFIELLQEPSSKADSTFETLLKHARENFQDLEYHRIRYTSYKALANALEEHRVWALHQSDDAVGHTDTDSTIAALKLIHSQPDESGLRLPVETIDDARFAVKQLLMNALTDTIGTTITLYSSGDDRLDVVGSVYAYRDQR